MIGYALFYFVRKNFSITMPALEAELGISKVKLGLFLTLHGIIYGLSRFHQRLHRRPCQPQEDDGSGTFPLRAREYIHRTQP